MPINLFDQNQVNNFKQDLVKDGYSPSEINEVVNEERQKQIEYQSDYMDLQFQREKQRVGLLELQQRESELLGLSPQQKELTGTQQKTADQAKIGLNLLDRLEQEIQSNSGKLGVESGLLTKLPGGIAKERKDLKSQINLATQKIATALEGGKLAEGDIKRYRQMMPSITDNPEVALRKLQNVRESLQITLSVTTGEQPGMSPGLELSQRSGMPDYVQAGVNPAINVYGEIAEPGDLMLDEATNRFYSYGETPEEKEMRFKNAENGGVVTTGLVSFLANSGALPAIGSIAGGLLGGPAALATGAAGASVGKAMQQGLRELLDPEEQEMSDMAKAVVIEGVTDAVLGAATFGIGTVGKSLLKETGELGLKGAAKHGLKAAGTGLKEQGEAGLKLVLGKPTSKLLAETAEAGVRETGEALGKEGLTGNTKKVRDLVARGLEIKPSKIEEYATKTGGRDLVQDLISQMGIPKSGKALQEGGEVLAKESGEKLSKMLEGQNLKTDDIVDILQDFQTKYLTPEGSVKTGYKSVMNQIDSHIQDILDYGDEIPANELNKIKGTMQEAFKVSGQMPKRSGMKAAANASREVRNFLGDAFPEYIDTNREKMLAHFAKEIGGKLDRKKAKALFNFSDLVVGSVNPALLAGKKGVDVFTNVIDDPLTQARLLDNGLKFAAGLGNRRGVRNILRLMMRMGITFTADNVAESMAEQDSEATPGMMEQPPGMGLQPAPLQNQPGLDLNSGNGMVNQPGFMYR